MNATLDLLASRRSVAPKLLRAPAPTDEQVQTLLTIASRVPDHGRLAPWRFIVIRPEGGAQLGEVIAAAHLENDPDADEERLQIERTRLTLAPLVIAVVSSPKQSPKAPEFEQILSAGAVCMNLVIAANAMGFSTNWLTQWYATDRRVLNALGLQPHEQIAGFIHIGTAAEKPTDRERPALSTIVTEYTPSAKTQVG
jgi:nitroreductase